MINGTSCTADYFKGSSIGNCVTSSVALEDALEAAGVRDLAQG